MDFKKQKPIYLQIADRLMDQMLDGTLKADDRMPSVREVAAQMGVNPNTVMRTFDHLQGEEMVYNRRGVGYFVAADARQRVQVGMRREFMDEVVPAICQRMQQLGISTDELTETINQQQKAQ